MSTLLITAVICYFHILFLWAFKNVEMSIEIRLILCPQKKMILTELHFSV